MNNSDREYHRLTDFVLQNGRRKKNRTGTDTIGAFGAQARFNLQEGFPLLTTKKVFMKSITHELLWFLSGSTNIKYLVDNGVNIWNDNAYAKYSKDIANLKNTEHLRPTEEGYAALGKDDFVQRIKDSAEFAKKYGDLGEGTYGGMWRAFPYYSSEDMEQSMKSPLIGDGVEMGEISFVKHVDQIQKVIDKLKTNPDDRRLIVSAWHPYWVDHCALPPCHCLFQFHTEELNEKEKLREYTKAIYRKRDETGKYIPQIISEKLVKWEDIPTRKLNCQLYQRSADLFLGVPFNIASYALLTSMIAHCSNMVPGEFIHTFGDIHIYVNHLDQIKEQRSREPKALPRLELNPNVRNLLDFKYEDIKIVGYESHPVLKGEMAV